MKHLKYFESKSDESIIYDIVDILINLQDDGYDVTLFSARGQSYELNSDFKFFRFDRYIGEINKIFTFQINFKKQKNLIEVIDFLNGIKTEINRLNDIGFDVYSMEINESNQVSLSKYSSSGVIIGMINKEKTS